MKTEQLIPLCRRYHAMLLHSDEQTISIAVVNTPPAELMEALRFATQKRIDIECWSQEQMDKRLPGPGKARRNWRRTTGRKISPNGSTRSSNRPCVSGRLIFISSPRKRTYASAWRVDGVLHALPLLAPELAAPVIARLKVLASLDIAEHRLPQDGQFALNLAGRPLSFRIATLPCRYGEKIVLRLLHQVDQALDLEALGLSSSQLAAFRQALNQPQGLLLVTGPTGSGKTVTLYSALPGQKP